MSKAQHGFPFFIHINKKNFLHKYVKELNRKNFHKIMKKKGIEKISRNF